MYELQPINKLLCFVVVRSSRELVWFSAAQSWWTVEAAHHFLQGTEVHQWHVNSKSRNVEKSVF